MQTRLLRFLTLAATLGTFTAHTVAAQNQLRVQSPDGRTVVTVEVREGGLFYSIQRDNRPLFLPSRLGFEFQGAPPLRDGLRITGSTTSTVDTVWTQPWGEVARVRDHHNELRISVSEVAAGGRQLRRRLSRLQRRRRVPVRVPRAGGAGVSS